MKVVVLMIGALFLIAGCALRASHDSMHDVDYSQREENQLLIEMVREDMPVWMRCDASDIEYKLVEKQQMQHYFLVSCPNKGLEDVRCMLVGGEFACIDSKGEIQSTKSKSSNFFVY